MTRSERIIRGLWSLSVVWPVLLVWGGSLAFAGWTGRPFAVVEELGPLIAQTFIAAVPYGALALYGHGKLAAPDPGAVAGVATATVLLWSASTGLWGWYYIRAATGSGGADFGAIFTLMASPLVLPWAIPIGYHLGRFVSVRRREFVPPR